MLKAIKVELITFSKNVMMRFFREETKIKKAEIIIIF